MIKPLSRKRSYEINMCEGPIFKKIIAFALPLVCSGILQLLFNAADIIVVGRFSGNRFHKFFNQSADQFIYRRFYRRKCFGWSLLRRSRL